MNSSFNHQSILQSLEDSSPAVRCAAVTALGNLKDNPDRLVNYLTDPDESVRQAAAKALRRRSDESRALVLELIEKETAAIDSALDALAPGNPESLALLRGYAKRELARARTLRNQSVSIPHTSRAAGFLCDCLRRLASLCEGRLIKTVGLFGDTRTMELVCKSMSGANIENRAAALEALDTIGDNSLRRALSRYWRWNRNDQIHRM